MTELDLAWSQLLDEAAQTAGASGRQDIVDYLRLRATNDAIRRVGVGWLCDSLTDTAKEKMIEVPNLKLERDEPHTFRFGNSTMVGTRLRLTHGVRRLDLEAGWARAPTHGIMRKGALAHARFSHFGIPKAGVGLRLVHGSELPQWLDDAGDAIDEHFTRRHLDVLLS